MRHNMTREQRDEHVERIRRWQGPLDEATSEVLTRIYVKRRIDYQMDYYRFKSNEFEESSDSAFRAGAIVLSLTSVLAAFSTSDANSFLYLLTAILPALAAMIASFRSLYQWDRQAQHYRDTILGLQRASLTLPDLDQVNAKTAAQVFTTLVEASEKVFYDEVSQWGQIAQGDEESKDTDELVIAFAREYGIDIYDESGNIDQQKVANIQQMLQVSQAPPASSMIELPHLDMTGAEQGGDVPDAVIAEAIETGSVSAVDASENLRDTSMADVSGAAYTPTFGETAGFNPTMSDAGTADVPASDAGAAYTPQVAEVPVVNTTTDNTAMSDADVAYTPQVSDIPMSDAPATVPATPATDAPSPGGLLGNYAAQVGSFAKNLSPDSFGSDAPDEVTTAPTPTNGAPVTGADAPATSGAASMLGNYAARVGEFANNLTPESFGSDAPGDGVEMPTQTTTNGTNGSHDDNGTPGANDAPGTMLGTYASRMGHFVKNLSPESFGSDAPTQDFETQDVGAGTTHATTADGSDAPTH